MRLCTYLDGISTQTGVILGDRVYPLGEASIKDLILKYDVADLNRIVSDDGLLQLLLRLIVQLCYLFKAIV